MLGRVLKTHPRYLSYFLNPFKLNASFLYLLETSEKLRFPDVFRRYRNQTFD